MVKIFVLITLFLCGILLFTMPWLSALTYTAVSILQPQYIWFWSFDGIPIFKITAGMAIIAWVLCAIQGNINWEIYKTGQFISLVILLCLMHLSNLLSPFPEYFAGVGAKVVLNTMNTIVIMYFIVAGLVNKEVLLKYFAFTLIITAVYYTYWANDSYLGGIWTRFSSGRLNGIPLSPYRDGNTLSIVLIVGLPFILFGIQYFKQKWIKVCLLLSIPLLWHALILFASRGALLSAVVVTLASAMILKSKSLNRLLLTGFIAILLTQGGMMMARTTSTISEAQNDNSEEPLNPRLVSWRVGALLTLKYPILGVGTQRFQKASNVHYPGESSHVAHNTFLNFSANSGVLAGLLYLTFFWVSHKQYKKVRDMSQFGVQTVHGYVNRAAYVSLLGFFVGATFLDMIIFEPFYFLLLLISTNYCLAKRQNQEPTHA